LTRRCFLTSHNRSVSRRRKTAGWYKRQYVFSGKPTSVIVKRDFLTLLVHAWCCIRSTGLMRISGKVKNKDYVFFFWLWPVDFFSVTQSQKLYVGTHAIYNTCSNENLTKHCTCDCWIWSADRWPDKIFPEKYLQSKYLQTKYRHNNAIWKQIFFLKRTKNTN